MPRVSNVGAASKYAAPGSEKVAEMVAAKKEELRTAFESFRGKGKLMDCKHIPACLERAGIGEAEGLSPDELRRIMIIAPIVTSKEGLTFIQLQTLARDAFNVNMLHKLFEDANTDTAWEKVECFLDENEIAALYKKIGVPIDKAAITSFIDNLDRDGDGRVDWEEFLTFSQEMLGGRIVVATDDPDGTDFNQLRDDLKYFDRALRTTSVVAEEYQEKISKKKKEIEDKIKDTELEDVRKKLKFEWDEKDRLELLLLSNTIKYFQGMEEVCRANDKEKADLVVVWNEEKAKRDMVRQSVASSRRMFKARYNERFGSYTDALALLGQIEKDTKPLFANLNAAEAASKEADAVWVEVREFEKQPTPSSSQKTLDFLNAQSKVLDQIRTKMQIMQRERDKYEEMINEELGRNKNARCEIIEMNLKLQMLDSQLSQKVDKYKTKVLENKSLQFEVTKAEGKGGGSKSYVTNQKKLDRASEKRNKQQKKLQKLENEIADIKAKTAKHEQKGKNLSIELGELKLFLDKIESAQDDEGDEGEDHLAQLENAEYTAFS